MASTAMAVPRGAAIAERRSALGRQPRLDLLQRGGGPAADDHRDIAVRRQGLGLVGQGQCRAAGRLDQYAVIQ